jgi:hypothetical protein
MSQFNRLPVSFLLGLVVAASAGCRLLPGGTTGESLSPREASLGAWAEGTRLRAPGSPVIQVGGLVGDEVRGPAIAHDPRTNAYVAVWQEKQGDRMRAFARLLDARLRRQAVPGSRRDAIELSDAAGPQTAPAVAVDARGIVTAWEQPTAGTTGIHARRLRIDGTYEGDPFRIGGDGSAAPAFSDAPVSGALLVAWQEPGRLLAAPLGAAGPGMALQLAGASSPMLSWFAARPEHPVVASAPAQERFMVGWTEGAAMKARLLNAAGGLGDVVDLGAGSHLKLTYDPQEQRFMAIYQHDGQVVARTLGVDGALSRSVTLGQGAEPIAVYDAGQRAFTAIWRSNGYIVKQRVSASLAPLGAAALMPSANARALAIAYNPREQMHVVACEETLFSFERLTLLKTP